MDLFESDKNKLKVISKRNVISIKIFSCLVFVVVLVFLSIRYFVTDRPTPEELDCETYRIHRNGDLKLSDNTGEKVDQSCLKEAEDLLKIGLSDKNRYQDLSECNFKNWINAKEKLESYYRDERILVCVIGGLVCLVSASQFLNVINLSSTPSR